MATIVLVHHKRVGFLAAALLASFRAVGHFIIMLAKSSSQVRALNQLGQLSDHNLSSKGLKRTAAFLVSPLRFDFPATANMFFAATPHSFGTAGKNFYTHAAHACCSVHGHVVAEKEAL